MSVGMARRRRLIAAAHRDTPGGADLLDLYLNDGASMVLPLVEDLNDYGPNTLNFSGSLFPANFTATAPTGTSALMMDGSSRTWRASGSVLNSPSVTLEAWVRPDASLMSSNAAEIIGRGEVAGMFSQRAASLFIRDSRIQFDTFRSLSQDRLVGPTLSADTWFHIAATYTSGSSLLYVNGELGAFSSPGGSINSTAAEVSLGNWVSPTQTYHVPFHGALCWVAWYRHVLTAEQVAAHYTAGSTP